eukprot:3751885-Pyramimonas_sp.AAC.1
MDILRSILTTSLLRDCSDTSGRYLEGSVSSASKKTPSAVILPTAWRSALHDTPMAAPYGPPHQRGAFFNPHRACRVETRLERWAGRGEVRKT